MIEETANLYVCSVVIHLGLITHKQFEQLEIHSNGKQSPCESFPWKDKVLKCTLRKKMILKDASDLAQRMDDGSFFVLGMGSVGSKCNASRYYPTSHLCVCVNVSVLVLYLFIVEG